MRSSEFGMRNGAMSPLRLRRIWDIECGIFDVTQPKG